MADKASAPPNGPIDLAELRRRRERERYAALVMKAWDDQEHAAKRDHLDRKAEVQIAARERI